jgi:hypothetical protein
MGLVWAASERQKTIVYENIKGQWCKERVSYKKWPSDNKSVLAKMLQTGMKGQRNETVMI